MIPATSAKQLKAHLIELGIKPGMVLAVHSNLITLGRLEGGVKMVLAVLWNLVGETGTLIFPAYTLNLDNENVFDPATTPSFGMGALSEHVRKSGTAKRSSCPTHSHLYTGAKSAELMHGVPSRSLGKESDFDIMHANDTKLLLLGCNYHMGATFIHHVEAMVGVPYREWINLIRRLKHPSGQVEDLTVEYYGRSPGIPWVTDLISVENEVNSRQVGGRAEINGGNSYLISLSDLYSVVSDMVENSPYALMVKETNDPGLA